MFANQPPRRDFADTLTAGNDGPWAWAALSRHEGIDANELRASTDAADRHLLGLVVCVAAATLLLAVAASLGA
jgi:hypothetical protein